MTREQAPATADREEEHRKIVDTSERPDERSVAGLCRYTGKMSCDTTFATGEVV